MATPPYPVGEAYTLCYSVRIIRTYREGVTMSNSSGKEKGLKVSDEFFAGAWEHASYIQAATPYNVRIVGKPQGIRGRWIFWVQITELGEDGKQHALATSEFSYPNGDAKYFGAALMRAIIEADNAMDNGERFTTE